MEMQTYKEVIEDARSAGKAALKACGNLFVNGKPSPQLEEVLCPYTILL